MSARVLAKRFFSYPLGQYQKKHNCSIKDILDFDGFNPNDLFRLIILGNAHKNNNVWVYLSEEDAAEILDDYLSENESNNYTTAYLEILDKFDRDIHLFMGSGISVKQIKAEMLAKVAEVKAATETKIEEYSDNKTDETPQPEAEDTVEADN